MYNLIRVYGWKTANGLYRITFGHEIQHPVGLRAQRFHARPAAVPRVQPFERERQ